MASHAPGIRARVMRTGKPKTLGEKCGLCLAPEDERRFALYHEGASKMLKTHIPCSVHVGRTLCGKPVRPPIDGLTGRPADCRVCLKVQRYIDAVDRIKRKFAQ
jgi:hypothetical protein